MVYIWGNKKMNYASINSVRRVKRFRRDDLCISRLKPADKQQLVWAWPPYFSCWNLDYTDGSYVTAIVSSVCFYQAVREKSALPRNIRTVLMSNLHARLMWPARSSLHFRASRNSLVCVDGLRPWRLKVAHIALSLVYFLSLSWNVFTGGICWKHRRSGCGDTLKIKITRLWSSRPNSQTTSLMTSGVQTLYLLFQVPTVQKWHKEPLNYIYYFFTFISVTISRWSSECVYMQANFHPIRARSSLFKASHENILVSVNESQ